MKKRLALLMTNEATDAHTAKETLWQKTSVGQGVFLLPFNDQWPANRPNTGTSGHSSVQLAARSVSIRAGSSG